MVYEFRFPDVGEGIHEGEVVRWKVKDGDRVTADQIIAEVQTDKALVEIPAPRSGIILKRNVLEGKTIKVGDVFCVLGEEGEKIEKTPLAFRPSPVPSRAPERSPKIDERVAKTESQMAPIIPTALLGRVIATPRTRQLARSLGVDLLHVDGSGKGGRITDDDVKRMAKGLPSAVPLSTPTLEATKRVPTVMFEKWGSVLRIPLKGIRKATAEHMTRAWATVPQVTHMDEADVSDLAARREKEKTEAEKKGFKLTFLPFITKAVIAALRLHSYFNSSLDKEDIVVKKYYNLGIAIDTSNGLMVPNIKNAEKLSILELAREMQTLAEKCRDRIIGVEDMQGGTFTITNIGSLGGIMATPIVNHPEVAILGVGAIRDKPVVRKGKIVVRKMLPLFLSFDHRVVDGAAAAKFMNDIIRHLEDPDLMLVDVV